jgi:hypothetical protein
MLEKRMKSHKPMFAEMTAIGQLSNTEYKAIVQLSQIRIMHESTREVELVNDDRYILTEKSFQELMNILLQNYYLD